MSNATENMADNDVNTEIAETSENNNGENLQSQQQDLKKTVCQSKKKSLFTFGNIASFVFLIFIIVFNVYIFSGASSRNSTSFDGKNGEGQQNTAQYPTSNHLPSDAPKGRLPGPGEPHPPNPNKVTPPHQGQKEGYTFFGPQLLLGLSFMNEEPNLAFTAKQKKNLKVVIQQLFDAEKKLADISRRATEILTDEQVDWISKNRGEAVPADGETEPGLDPTTSAMVRLLKARAGGGSEEIHPHPYVNFQFQDVLNGVLKMETQAPKIAISASQANSFTPIMTEVIRNRQEGTELFAKVYKELTQDQKRWLTDNSDKLNFDINTVILRYTLIMLSEEK